jgi:hypothetical protein
LVEGVFEENPCLQGVYAVWDTARVQGAWSPGAVEYLGNGLKVVADDIDSRRMVAVWSSQGQGCRMST